MFESIALFLEIINVFKLNKILAFAFICVLNAEFEKLQNIVKLTCSLSHFDEH